MRDPIQIIPKDSIINSPLPTYHFKLVLLGDTSVGKSSLVVRFTKNEFVKHQEPTIGAAFITQRIQTPEAIISFEIWDTAGAERYRSLAPMYYRGASAAIIAYDITNKDSFEGAKSWVSQLLACQCQETIIALVGNKCDLHISRAVDTSVAKSYAESSNLIFFETSAKTGCNVFDLFKEIAKRLPNKSKEKNDSNSGFQLSNRTTNDVTKKKNLIWFCCSTD